MGSLVPQKKPLLFFMSCHGEGHTNPVLSIAAALIKRGYEVVYLCSDSFKTRIVDAGAEFIEMPDFYKGVDPVAKVSSGSMDPRLLASQISHVFYKSLPAKMDKVSEALEMVKSRDPTRQIIVVEDGPHMGVLTYKYGRKYPAIFGKPPKTIGISPVPLMIESRDTAPFMLGLPPDSTESGRLRNEVLNKMMLGGPLGPLVEEFQDTLKRSGCTTEPEGNPFTHWFTPYDATFMLCSPSLEYPLSDLPPMIHFAGVLPRIPVKPNFQFPDWWSEVSQNDTSTRAKAKNVLFVSQGTVRGNWGELLLPTLQAFAGREDILLVAALGKRGAVLDSSIEVPSNARVIDYLPYDTMLEYTDVFISNAGYGGFGHAVKNGVPSVFAGQSEDKKEVTARAAWAGFAVNLKTQMPSVEQLRQGVDEVLGNWKYKERALQLKKENEELDALSTIERQIEAFTE